MKKKELFQAVVVGEYLAFFIATILVVVFQFIGTSLLIKLSLIFYTVAFILSSIENISLCVSLFKIKDKDIAGTITVASPSGEETTLEGTKKNLKQRKVKAVTLSILSVAVSVFTLVVLIMF